MAKLTLALALGLPVVLATIASGCGPAQSGAGGPTGPGGGSGAGGGGGAGAATGKGPCDRFGPITADSSPEDRPCTHDLKDRETWMLSTIGDETFRFLTYVVPSRQDARMPTTFVRFGVADRHYKSLQQSFPDLFPTLNSAEWDALTADATRREFYTGPLAEISKPGVPKSYAFGVVEWPLRVPPYGSSLTVADATRVYDEIRAHAPWITTLTLVPLNSRQKKVMAGWKNTPFQVSLDEIGLPDEHNDYYQVYTEGRGYGIVRIYTLDGLEKAQERGELSYQDIIVVDEAPSDLEAVVSGILTGTPQALLTHLNVRTNARGTPNCFLRHAIRTFRYMEGKVVHMDCTDSDVWLTPETLKDAQVWWDSFRPPAIKIPALDVAKAPMPSLLELPTKTKEERAAAVVKYGAKGTNLATLYQLVPPELQFKGFLIPAYYYDQFMRTATWTPEGATAPMTFRATIEAWLKDETFRTDTKVRLKKLAALRKAIKASAVDGAALAEIKARIKAVLGSEGAMVRLRSSSNAEDALEFAGAGLYDSTSACALDVSAAPTPDEPAKPEGAKAEAKKAEDKKKAPRSKCDKASKARSLERGLTRVWASVWNPRAFDEREWSRLDHLQVGMSVLATSRSDAERANMVAFTGSPVGDDPRYVVNAQRGDNRAVTTARGQIAETTLITVAGGKVTDVKTVTKSNVAPVGKPVVPEKELRRMAELLAKLTQTFPIDDVAPEGGTILLDTEWKLLGDGRLVIKQIRPFLRKPLH